MLHSGRPLSQMLWYGWQFPVRSTDRWVIDLVDLTVYQASADLLHVPACLSTAAPASHFQSLLTAGSSDQRWPPLPTHHSHTKPHPQHGLRRAAAAFAVRSLASSTATANCSSYSANIIERPEMLDGCVKKSINLLHVYHHHYHHHHQDICNAPITVKKRT